MPSPIAITALDDPRVSHYQRLADPAQLVERGLFVAEGRLVVRQLLELRQWNVHSILLTPAAVDNLTDVLAYSATSILTQTAPGKAPLPGRSIKLGLQASF